MPATRRTCFSPPACCTPATGCGRWSCIAASRSGRLSEVLGDDDPRHRQAVSDARSPRRRESGVGSRLAAGADGARALRRGRERAYGQHARPPERPLEFQILGFMPAPWKPVDSLAVGRLLAWRLAENHQAELVRAALAAKFGAETALLLAGRYPANAPAILEGARPPAIPTTQPRWPAQPAIATAGAAPPSPARPATRCPPAWNGCRRRRVARTATTGSWPIAGPRAGRPILANDPHLQIEFPSVWYEMHLVAADLDVVGVTIPGVPFVVLGHNARIAWGMTNTGADVQDLALERIDVGGKRSFYRGEWVPIEVVKADIPVRGRSQPLPFEVWKTRNGPIFAEVGLRLGRAAVVAVARRSARRGAARLFAALGCQRRSRHGVRRDQPRHRLGVVHRRGRRVSRRRHRTSSMPTSTATSAMRCRDDCRSARAATAACPWTAPPARRGPARSIRRRCRACSIRDAGFISSSNNLVDRSYQPLITHDWAAPFRATRLRDQLSKAEGVDLDAMAALQNDRRSAAADVAARGTRRGDQEGPRASRTSGAGPIASKSWPMGPRRRQPADRLLLPGVRGRGVAADVHRRDGRGAVLQVLRVGGRGKAGRHLCAARRSAVEVVGRHRHRRDRRKRATTSS